jgi:hypothetical protein
LEIEMIERPIWKKIDRIDEPGLYLWGGSGTSPLVKSAIIELEPRRLFDEYWFAYLGPMPQPEMPKPDLKIDDPVIVWMNNCEEERRYFAGWSEDGRIICWAAGGTSWSTGSNTTWYQWRLPTPEELKK